MKKITQFEKSHITKNWKKLSIKEIAKNLNRSVNSVQHIAAKLNVTHSSYWSEKDLVFLKINYGKISNKDLAEKFNRKVAYVVHKANELGLTNQQYKRWTMLDLKFLKENYSYKSNSELSKLMNRTPESIKRKALKLNLTKNFWWTESDLEFLKNNYKTLSNVELCNNLNRTLSEIRNQAYRLCLRRIKASTILEEDFEKILIDLKLDYKKQIKFWKYRTDFVVDKFVIETYGSYWHCDPKIYKSPKNKMQELKIKRDTERTKYLYKLGYSVIIIWESDFYESPEQIKKQLSAVLGSNIEDNNWPKSVELLRDNTEVIDSITKGESIP